MVADKDVVHEKHELGCVNNIPFWATFTFNNLWMWIDVTLQALAIVGGLALFAIIKGILGAGTRHTRTQAHLVPSLAFRIAKQHYANSHFVQNRE